jgi:peptidoglycan/LPS O-acetylase OafA/YrhL
MAEVRAAPASAITQAGEVRSARVESLRAIAALGVLIGHLFLYAHVTAPIPPGYGAQAALGGGFGVFLFFVLSGYLLFWPFAKQAFGGGTTVELRRYALNRVLRIVPLYAVSVVVVLAIQGAPLSDWLLFLGFAENFLPATAGANPYNGVLWSVVVEAQFYVVLPLLALGLGMVSGKRRWAAAAILIALAAASCLLRIEATTPVAGIEHPHPTLEYSLPGTFVFFVPGMLLALLRLELEQRRTSLRGVLARGDLWLVLAAGVWALQFARYDWFLLAAAASFLMVGAAVLPGIKAGPLLGALEWRPLALIGVASYSLYIWHVPILAAITESIGPFGGFPVALAVGLPLCLAAALLSYAAIERPFLRLRRRWGAPPVETAG